MKYMPKTKKELEGLVNDLFINLGDIDTSKITDMSGLFRNTKRTDFSGIENWDVSRVVDMLDMFNGAASFNADISKWDVSKVENMIAIFCGAKSFNQDISKWNVSNVEDMFAMFQGAKSFTADISKWNVSNVTNMDYMFCGTKSFNQDLSDWDLSSIKYIDDATKDLIYNGCNNTRRMQ